MDITFPCDDHIVALKIIYKGRMHNIHICFKCPKVEKIFVLCLLYSDYGVK